jgi:hypothetical protein
VKLFFVCVGYDATLWRLLEKLDTRHVKFTNSAEGHQTASLMCSTVREVESGFLRLEIAQAAGSPEPVPTAIWVHAPGVLWIVEIAREHAIGFAAQWAWPFPSNRTTDPADEA